MSLFSLIGVLSSSAPPSGKGASDAWSPTTIQVLDPDHFSVAQKSPFQRVTAPRLDDVPCSPQNPLRVKPLWAYLRGKMAEDAGKYEIAGCWFHIGLQGGDARSRSGMGDLNRKGLGTGKNAQFAVTWYERAAQGGAPYAAKMIAEMYDTGELPMDATKSQTWHARAQSMKEEYDRRVAEEKKKEADDWAALHATVAIALVGGQLLTWDVGADPDCDIRARDRLGNPVPDSVDPAREARRDRMVANGEMYCGKPIDISPLFPENWR